MKTFGRLFKFSAFNFEHRISKWILLLVVAVLLGCTSKNQNSGGLADQYTCPMHPTVISDKQGTCPVCGMDLVRKVRAGEEVKITEDIARLLQSPDKSVVASVRTTKGVYKKMPLMFSAHGVVAYDTRRVYTIPAQIGGRLEHVYLRYPFQGVHKGQKVAEIYSPELLTAQRELLFLVANDPANKVLIAAAMNKLQLLGSSALQVDELIQKKEADARFTIFSPYDGYVILPEQKMPVTNIARAAAAPASPSGMENSGMGAGATPSTTVSGTSTAASLTREGDYVARGQVLFTVASSSALRLELTIPSIQAVNIRAGDPLIITLGKDDSLKTRVDFVQPFFSAGEEFQKVRVYLQRTDLRIGQLVDATIRRMSGEALWVKKEAVLDLGSRKVVFIKERGVFKPRDVAVGVRYGDWFEIRQGISSSDEIAEKANYLVDSESFIKSN